MRIRLSVIFLCTFLSFTIATRAQQITPQPMITQALDEGSLVTLKGNTHPFARPQFDVGVAAPDQPMRRMLLVLKRSPEQEFDLRKLLDDQQDKASPNYHKWLTPNEFGQQFGPADQDLQIVTGWLQSHGLQVNRVTHGRTIIEFTGVESKVEEALHTQIHKYLVNGEEHWANASDPQIPAALAPAVAGVWSLHDFRKKPHIHISPEILKTKYTPGKQPDTNLTGSNGAVIHALSPADFAVIYNLNPLYANGVSGTGNIAVVARSNLFQNGQDVLNFEQTFDPLCCGGVQIVLDGPDPGDLGGGEEAEATLDATWSSAVAPAATVKFVVSASTLTTDGVDLSELYIIDNNIAPIMTESFGSCDALATQAEAEGLSTLAEQAAAQGTTYMVSSGDSGAAGCDNPNTAPATHGQSPSVLGTSFNVVVGGTEFNENGNTSKYWSSQNAQSGGSALSYIPEDVWNESCSSCQFPNLFSSGGGVSKYFTPKPTWQFGVMGIPNDGARDQPDVALTAAAEHDPYLLCLEGSCVPDSQGFISLFLIGGTSAAAPSFAGIMALVNQQHGPQGQANYVLYRLAAAESSSLSQCNASKSTTLPASTCVFNDVTTGNNSVPGQTGFSAGTGYDLATGLGSVNVNNLVNQWSNITFRATTTTLTPGTITGTHGSPVSLGISVAPNSGSGTPTGDVSLLTSNNQSVGFMTLSNGAVSAPVNDLPGGSYTLTAQYAGDGTFAPSPPSSPISVTVSPENSSTVLSVVTAGTSGSPIPFTGGPYGSFVFLNADVAGNSGQGVPTGQVSIMDNSNLFTSLAINAVGNATTPQGVFTFGAGNHSLQAQYPGDASFNPSSSSTVNFNITKATTSTTISAAPVKATAGSNISLTAAVTSAGLGNSPSGQVNFFLGNTLIGNAPLESNGITQSGAASTAFFSTSSLPTGQDSISATYVGDANYLSSNSSAATVTLDPDFAFAASNSTVTISTPGASGTDVLTVTGQPGYNSTISFSAASCSGLPLLASCSFTPASITGSGSTTVTITTKAPSRAVAHMEWSSVGFIFAGVLLLNLPMRRFRRLAAISAVFAAIAITSVGCGGGSSGGGGGSGSPSTSPPGTYSILVVATTNDGAISHAAAFTLTIQ